MSFQRVAVAPKSTVLLALGTMAAEYVLVPVHVWLADSDASVPDVGSVIDVAPLVLNRIECGPEVDRSPPMSRLPSMAMVREAFCTLMLRVRLAVNAVPPPLD